MREISQQAVTELKERARSLRCEVIKMLGKAGSGHTGGSLSAADVVACLYFWEMRLDNANPGWPERDRFVLSKGHAAPLLYAALAEKGFIPREELQSLRRLGSRLQGHPDMRKVPGVEASTGSLGQGIAWAVGMALAGRLDAKDYRVYTLLGDGEIQEGEVWEAVMAAAHYRLDNLVAIVDYNGLQIDGAVDKVMSPLPIAAKFEAFGWNTQEIDGHDFRQIMQALEAARGHKGRPSAIVARTVKGKGVSFMENGVDWHGKAPNTEQVERALAELAVN
ncbi:MAG: transketolase [Syntrophothermus sp.]|uniref:transketolase n=1 Tax=Syntrophothermus sp. TaxID=2736299 RepID=UPI00257CB342|nr:transketolase [Syntrophothermus sp.]NSW83943.1 transketolase [Syntrophothermus sp.]